MAKVELKLKEKKDPELIDFARNVIIQMNGNPFYTEKKPQLNELIQAINDLESAYTINKKDKNSALLLRLSRNTIELMLTRLALFVEDVTEGKKVLIHQCGMETRKTTKKHIINKPNQ